MDFQAIDLYSGAGGASIGLQRADGIDVIAAVDIDEAACESYDENLPLTPHQADLRETGISDICDHFDITKDDIDIVVGCPPCQNFSTLRRTSPWPDGEPKDELLVAFVDRILEASPSVVVFENVPGILDTDDGQYVEWFKSIMRKAGYGVTLDVVNAADYGVPQRRKRTIGICVKGISHNEVLLPPTTHAENPEEHDRDVERWVTVRDEIADLPSLEAGESATDIDGHRARNHQSQTIELMQAIPTDGGSRSDLPEELELDCHKRLDGGGAGNVYGRMAWDEPASTLTTRCTSPSSGRFVHPEQHRAITPREAARLMSFPDSFELPSKNSDAERLVGNAVPPRLMTAIVEGVLQNLEEIGYVWRSQRSEQRGLAEKTV